MNDIKLLPCPFCGSPGELFQDTSSDYERNWTWVGQCSDHDSCWIEGPHAATPEESAALWNRRTMNNQPVLDFYNRVCVMAERKIEMTHKLEGAHYASMRELIREYR